MKIPEMYTPEQKRELIRAVATRMETFQLTRWTSLHCAFGAEGIVVAYASRCVLR